jgi:hypothetical protein
MMNQNQCNEQVSFRLYISACRAAWVGRIWAKLQGQPRQLRDLTAVAASGAVGDRRAARTQAVPIHQICGSEGRCEDFDSAFRPLKAHTQDRWLNVARAFLGGHSLPPVELIQIGAAYFVRDGHHRISVAAAIGQKEIDAVVTIWQIADPMLQERQVDTGTAQLREIPALAEALAA